MNEHRRLGVVGPSIPDERDWQFPPAAPTEPQRHFAVIRMPTLQGIQSSCVWNTFPFIIEAAARAEQGLDIDVSRAFGYYETRKVRGWEKQDSGCFHKDAIQVCQRIGFVGANRMKYDERDYKTSPQQVSERTGYDLYAEASRNRTAEFRAAPTIAQIRAALLRGYTPGICFTVARSFQKVESTGLWVPLDGPIDGAHSVAIVGFDDFTGEVWLANWWKRWGVDHPLAEQHAEEGGHFARFKGSRRFWRVPYEVIESAAFWDAFTVHTIHLEQ